MLLLPAAVLLGVAFAAPVAAWTVTLKTTTPMNYVFRFGSVPLMLFSGTFFPVSQLPGWLRPVAYATPLWHGVALCRSLALGTVTAGSAAIHVGYLAAMAAIGLWCGRAGPTAGGSMSSLPEPEETSAVAVEPTVRSSSHAVDFSSFPGARGLRLIERHARFYRRMWLVVASGAAEPLFYLLSVGVGIGGLIGTVPGRAGTRCRTGSSSRPGCSRSPR